MSESGSSNQTDIDNSIYKDFCNGLKNQSREHIRLTGEIASRATKSFSTGRSADSISATISNFCRVEIQLENIENNLNKVCALTRNQK